MYSTLFLIIFCIYIIILKKLWKTIKKISSERIIFYVFKNRKLFSIFLNKKLYLKIVTKQIPRIQKIIRNNFLILFPFLPDSNNTYKFVLEIKWIELTNKTTIIGDELLGLGCDTNVRKILDLLAYPHPVCSKLCMSGEILVNGAFYARESNHVSCFHCKFDDKVSLIFHAIPRNHVWFACSKRKRKGKRKGKGKGKLRYLDRPSPEVHEKTKLLIATLGSLCPYCSGYK